ncbi:MAG: hypothetical protein ACFE95_18205 [Candidatus Hodarchaeota archaeon]
MFFFSLILYFVGVSLFIIIKSSVFHKERVSKPTISMISGLCPYFSDNLLGDFWISNYPHIDPFWILNSFFNAINIVYTIVWIFLSRSLGIVSPDIRVFIYKARNLVYQLYLSKY